MKFSLRLLFSFAFLLATVFFTTTNSFAQVESVVGQITSTPSAAFVRDMSGDGRFVVFESNGDLATEKTPDRNNLDGNFEIFLFDYAQRRIFQITNTIRALKNVTGSSTASANIQVDIVNTTPVISNDGRYIAFASNAYSGVSGNTSPASFNGNLCTAALADCNVDANGNNANRPTLASLRADGNLEIFLYQIPAVAPVDLASGADVPLIDLAAGNFSQATNSPRSLPPLAGTATQSPIVRADNNLPAINDNGSVVAFVSNRDLVPAGSIAGQDTGNTDTNREIFVYLQNVAASNTRQITKTAPGDAINQIYNINPAISGDGRRVVFASTATDPVRGASGGNNADVNLEVFYANLDAAGEPSGASADRQVQITRTVRAAPENAVNILSPGKRISRDGRFIAFESLSNNPSDVSGGIQTGYAVYVYDAAPTAPTRYRQFAARSFDDAAATGGDVRRYPSFTDYASGAAASLIFTSRFNYRADGTLSASTDGLNPDGNRPAQIYATPLDAAVSLVRLSRIPTFNLSDLQPFASNTRERIAFNLANSLGGENTDGGYEGFYLISPNAFITANSDQLTNASGASARPVGAPSPVPSPSPTPVTPNAVPALSRGAIALGNLNYASSRSNVNAAGGSTSQRSFELPIELGGVTVNIAGAAAGIYAVDYQQQRVIFVIPKGLANGTYQVTVNDNGRLSRSNLTIVTSQPDILRRDRVISANGRALIFNTTNFPLIRSEPFFIRTIRRRPYGNVQTRVILYLTGVRGLAPTDFNIRIGDQTITGAQILTGAVETVEPGVYYIEFLLPAALNGAGDVPIIITTTSGAASRLDDTAPRLRIL